MADRHHSPDLFELSPDPLGLVDAQARVVQASRALRERLGQRATHLTSLLDAAGAARFRAALATAVQSGEPNEMATPARGGAGVMSNHAFSIRPIAQNRALVSLRDIESLAARSSSDVRDAQRYALYSEDSRVWLWETDDEHRFTYLSPNFEEVSSLNASDFMHRSRREALASGVKARWAPEQLAAVASLRPFKDCRAQVVNHAGARIWCNVSGAPRFDATGRFTGYRGLGVAITAQVEAERACIKAEERFRDFTEATSDWLWETDAEHRFTMMTSRVEEIAGVPADFHIGKTRQELLGADEVSEEVWRPVMEALGAHQPFRGFRYWRSHPITGARQCLETSGKPVFDEDGAFVGYRGSGTDVTKEMLIYVELESRVQERTKELRAARDEAMRANHAKTDFLAHMSHELRTPLNAILGFSEIMTEEMLGPLGNKTYGAYARDIHTSGAHLLDLISRVLDISRIESGVWRPEDETVVIAEAARSALRLVEGAAEKKRQTIALDLSPEIEAVRADMRGVKQMFINLLTNAVKFTPTGGEIAIATRLRGDQLEVAVSDNGVGIDPVRVEEILGPFNRVRNPMIAEQEGVGLGLAIVKALIAHHDGRLEIDTAVGEGVTARLIFPAKRVIASAAPNKPIALAG